MSSHYVGDPYWTVARFNSHCTGCGANIRKGESIFYYPKTKSVFGKNCGCAENNAAEFRCAVADEDFYNNYNY